MGLNTTPATWSVSELVTALKMNTEVRDALIGIQSAWTAWTPTVAGGLTVGNGTWTGAYKQVGKDIEARFSFTFGTTSSCVSALLLFPVAINASYPAQTNCGVASFYNGTVATKLPGGIIVNSTASSGVGSFALTATGGQTTATVPFTWATGSILSGTLIYEAA